MHHGIWKCGYDIMRGVVPLLRVLTEGPFQCCVCAMSQCGIVLHLTSDAFCPEAYLHDRGIIHRSLKPKSVLVGTSPTSETIGVFKLTDFGIDVRIGHHHKTRCVSFFEGVQTQHYLGLVVASNVNHFITLLYGTSESYCKVLRVFQVGLHQRSGTVKPTTSRATSGPSAQS